MAFFTLHHRMLSLLVITAITVFFAAGLRHVELRTIFSDLLPKNHPFVQTYADHPNFGNPLTVTVMVKRKDGDIYNPETLQKVWDITRDIDLTPGVDHDQILSISTEKARYSEATPYGIESQPLMGDAVPANDEELAEFRLRVDKAPNARAFLISEDESATLIKATFIERLIDYGEIFDYVQQLVDREPAAKAYEPKEWEIKQLDRKKFHAWFANKYMVTLFNQKKRKEARDSLIDALQQGELLLNRKSIGLLKRMIFS